MNKRLFLGTALAAGAAPILGAAAVQRASGPALLTVTGDVKPNRPAFDPARDVMMSKHQLTFSNAHAFDFAALLAMRALTIKPTLEYDARVHSLRGPLLAEVLATAGARLTDTTQLVLRAVDGYAATITLAQARSERFIVATHMDGQPMALGGLGPLWAVVDADRLPALAARPLAARFALCPWALYHIEVRNQA
ncbi:molybdopterin-dependent oxidoreductase [Massilia sp. PAMC28688]|uniref:molybdopterin-dependent oxidoreductase n=1 Tax=Massilia sp. PAMC28688 TaxID=2861283 RepID=UPI001C62961E|nr:molybdopterin-dependent oxidoreductase [Massilia sp. PAMC28688]QYF95124.1 molybdopterin-dependent oxidoreductase [Massilia sp. PAMC28688]